MIAEAIDTLWTLGWALLAWIVVGATVVTVGLLGTVAAVWGAWRWLYARVRRPKPANAAPEGQGAHRASQARSGDSGYREAA